MDIAITFGTIKETHHIWGLLTISDFISIVGTTIPIIISVIALFISYKSKRTDIKIDFNNIENDDNVSNNTIELYIYNRSNYDIHISNILVYSKHFKTCDERVKIKYIGASIFAGNTEMIPATKFLTIRNIKPIIKTDFETFIKVSAIVCCLADGTERKASRSSKIKLTEYINKNYTQIPEKE